MKTRLELPQVHYKSIINHIDSAPGFEVCGLIGGVWQPYDKRAVAYSVVAVPNIDPHPAVRYTMEPKGQVKAMLDFDQQGWEMVGVYHSHPHGPTQPSPTDIAEATYPDAIYLIGVPGGALTAWRILNGQVHAVLLEMMD